MNDVFVDALKRLSNEQLLIWMFGAWCGFVMTAIYFRLPTQFRKGLRIAKWILAVLRIIVANQKIIAAMLLEIALKLKIQISAPSLQNIENYNDDEDDL